MCIRFILFFLISLTSTFAQSNRTIDRLKQDIYKGTAETKLVAYHLLITELQQRDPKAVITYIKQLKSFSKKNELPKGRGLVYYHLGLYYNLQGKFDSLKIYADSCLLLTKEKNNSIYSDMGYHLLGTYYWQVGLYPKSINSHLKALKIRQSVKDSIGIGASLASLGAVYLSSNQLDKAEEFVKGALVIADNLGEDRLNLRSLHTLANIYGTRGLYDEALKVDYKALAICSRTNNLRGYSEIYSNMALCYFYKDELDASLNYHYKVLSIDKAFNDNKQIGDTYLNLASVYRKKNDFKKAKDLLLQAIELFKKTNYKHGLKNAYHSLSDGYREIGNYEQAYNSYLEYTKVANQLTNEANHKQIATLNVEYETEQREQKIRNLSQQARIQKLEIEQRNAMLTIVIGLFLTVAILAYFINKQKQLKERTILQDEINKQQRMATQAVFDAEEQERRRIATELHDGVGQTLSAALINLNMLFRKNPKNVPEEKLASNCLALLSEGYDELRAISHQMIPNVLLKKGLRSAIQDLLNKIDGKQIKARFEVSGIDYTMSSQVESAIYRIVQEAVNNVLKHASATRLDIQLINDYEGISLTIEDNGRGFEQTQLQVKEGIGLKNIRSRVKLLRGTLDVESAIGHGTLIAIHLPF